LRLATLPNATGCQSSASRRLGWRMTNVFIA
jgi:hypothetical protein